MPSIYPSSLTGVKKEFIHLQLTTAPCSLSESQLHKAPGLKAVETSKSISVLTAYAEYVSGSPPWYILGIDADFAAYFIHGYLDNVDAPHIRKGERFVPVAGGIFFEQ